MWCLRLYHDARGPEKWKTNGTSEGTEPVRSTPGIGFYPEQLIDINGTLFFSAYDAGGARKLWKTDGATERTIKVPVIYRGSDGHDPNNLTLFNGKLYFDISGVPYANGLWQSDGTEAGTTLIEASLRYPFISPRMLTAVGDKLFFIASSPSTGVELYMYKNSLAAPIEIRDLRQGDTNPASVNYEDIINLKAGGDRLYFQTTTNNSTFDYWTSDGSAAGTYRILRITNTTTSIRQLEYYNGKMYFIVSNTNGPTGLWATTGTAAGTLKVATLPSVFPAASSTIMNDILYFSGTGQRLWRTDGSACGTFVVPATRGVITLGRNELFTYQDERIVFGGFSPGYGTELFKLESANAPENSCETVSASAEGGSVLVETEEREWRKGIASSPNPFNIEFSLRVNTAEDKAFDASVMSVDGRVISSQKLQTNTTYTMGQELRSGIFLLKVVVDHKVEVRRIIKTN